jgi:hypothetical protein
MHDCHHQTTGDPKGAEADTEEVQNVGTEPKRTEQHRQRFRGDLVGDATPLGRRPTSQHLIEDECRADGLTIENVRGMPAEKRR